MEKAVLSIGPASPSDIDQIWHLLHAASMGWSDEKISLRLTELILLKNQDKLIGVLYGSINTPEKIHWVVIHPMYPEKTLSQLMITGFESMKTVSPSLIKFVLSPA